MVEYDTTHRFLSVDNHVWRILGYSREELLGKRVLDITAAKDLENIIQINNMVQSGEYDKFAYGKRYVSRDGSWSHEIISKMEDEKLIYATDGSLLKRSKGVSIWTFLMSPEVCLIHIRREVKTEWSIGYTITIHCKESNNSFRLRCSASEYFTFLF